MAAKKKIIFVIPSLKGGGSEKVMLTIFNELESLNIYSLIMVVLDAADMHPNFQINRDLLVDLKCKKVRNSLPKLLKIINKERPNIVFSTLGHLNLFLSIFRFLFPKKTILVARESSIVSVNIKNDKYPVLFDWLYRRFYKSFDMIVCQSVFMKEDLASNYNIRAVQMKVINNPVNVAQLEAKVLEKDNLELADGGKNIIAVGRLSKEKGFERLIEAMSLMRDKGYKLYILGEGVLKEQLQLIINNKNLQDVVCLLGFKGNPYPYMKACGVLAIASYYEGFPNVAIEMMALGKPVVAYDAPGGINEIILEGVNGYIVPSDSALAYCKSLEQAIEILKDENEIKKTTQRYEKNKIISLYVELFEKVMESRR